MVRFLESFFQELSGGQRLFAYVVTIAFAVLSVTFFSTDNFVTTIVISLFCFVLIFLTTMLVVPAEERKQRTIRHSTRALFAISLVALSGAWWIPLLPSILQFNDTLSSALTAYQPKHAVMVMVLFFLAHLALLFTSRDRTAMGRLDMPIEEEFRDLNFSESFHVFCEELKTDLLILDRDLRWNISHFVPLEAEVEIISKRNRSMKIMNLLHALKSIRSSRVLLVLGVPGAGKSVALRKLCVDLIGEASISGRIPVYINLKEWFSNRTWTNDTPPTEQEFKDFVVKNVRSRIADQSRPFFDRYFLRFVARGRIFFVLDSFDEIPGVLDVNEASVLLEKISDVIAKFLKSGYQSRGIIASRYYRRPHLTDRERGTFEIRPFSELQISHAIEKASALSSKLVKDLFDNKPDLSAAMRNPFVLSLVLRYIATLRKLPDKQSELFEYYINDSLDLAEENIIESGLSKNELLEAMQELSWVMFDSDRFGLEMPIMQLRKLLPDLHVDDIASVLQSARLVRVGGFTRTFSFVHRRFNEYFLVNRFINNPETAPLEAIPTDSRWRDAMVLYTEVANDEAASKIAEYCWREIQVIQKTSAFDNPEQYLRSLHSLRFLIEAFRGRRTALKSFQDELGEQVLNFATEENDLVTTKHAVEAIGLLSDSHAQPVLIAALRKSNEWISQTALRACRYLSRLDSDAKDMLIDYIWSISTIDLLKRNRELSFSLEAAEIYKPIARELNKRTRESKRVIFLSCLLTLCAPPLIGISIVVYLYNLISVVLIEGLMRGIKPLPKIKSRLFELISNMINVNTVHGVFDHFLVYYRIMSVLFLPVVITILLSNKRDLAGVISFVNEYTLDRFLPNTLYIEGIGLGPFSVMAAVALTLMFPGRRLWIAVRGLMNVELKEVLTVAFSIIIVGILFFSINELVIKILPVWFKEMFMVLVVVLVGVLFFWVVVLKIKSWFEDKKLLKELTRVFTPERLIIGQHFSSFKTKTGRLKYSRWVEISANDHLPVLGDPKNSWPENVRPNVANDEASTLLAQLDVRWLKLDI